MTEPTEEDPRDPDGAFKEVKVDTRIQFCVPHAGLFEETASSINFRQLTSTSVDDANIFKEGEVGVSPLDPKKYINVWIAPLRENNSGFAQIPGGEVTTDGIVIDPKFFGSSGTARAPYDRGKTLTHLIGSYLGLSPIWGDGTSCGDDGISDTPIHNGPNFGAPGKGHVSTCADHPIEMTMNFMDATDDAWLHMFTREQAIFMRTVLSREGPRGGLLGTATKCSERERETEVRDESKATLSDRTPTVVAYPNPASTTFEIQLNASSSLESIDQIQVYDLKGASIFQQSGVKSQTISVNANDWTRGVYLVKVILTSGDKEVIRITLQ